MSISCCRLFLQLLCGNGNVQYRNLALCAALNQMFNGPLCVGDLCYRFLSCVHRHEWKFHKITRTFINIEDVRLQRILGTVTHTGCAVLPNCEDMSPVPVLLTRRPQWGGCLFPAFVVIHQVTPTPLSYSTILGLIAGRILWVVEEPSKCHIQLTPRSHRCNVTPYTPWVTQREKWKQLLPRRAFAQKAEAAVEANNGGDVHFSCCDASRILC